MKNSYRIEKNAGVFFALTEVESTAGASKDEQVDDDVDELGQRRLRVRAPEQRHQLRLCPVSRRRARRGDDDRESPRLIATNGVCRCRSPRNRFNGVRAQIAGDSGAHVSAEVQTPEND